MKVLTIVAIVIAVIVLGFVLRYILFPISALDKGIDVAYEVMDKTLDADKAIYNYEWFKQTAEDIKALGKKEDRAEQNIQIFMETADNSREDKNEIARLRAIKTGLANMLDDTIAKYNARSQMVNRAIFKDNLPSNINRAWVATINLIK